MLRAQSPKKAAALKAQAEAAANERREGIARRIGTYRVERAVSVERAPTPLNIPKVEVASWESSTLRALARGQPCYLRTPVCTGGGDDRTVLMHGDRVKWGNCQGGKGSDFFAIPVCPECHHFYGHGRRISVADMESMFIDGVHRWWCWLLETGRVRIGKPR